MVRICCGCPRIAGAGRRLAESEPGGAGEENAGNTQQQECGSPPKPLCKPATGDERNEAAGLARHTEDRKRECTPSRGSRSAMIDRDGAAVPASPLAAPKRGHRKRAGWGTRVSVRVDTG